MEEVFGVSGQQFGSGIGRQMDVLVARVTNAEEVANRFNGRMGDDVRRMLQEEFDARFQVLNDRLNERERIAGAQMDVVLQAVNEQQRRLTEQQRAIDDVQRTLTRIVNMLDNRGAAQ